MRPTHPVPEPTREQAPETVAPVSAPVVPRPLPLAVRLVLGVYGLAWRALLPGLKRNGRLAEGWDQRTLAAGLPPRADLFIHAASGGEAYLAWELLRNLPAALAARQPGGAPVGTPLSAPLRVLVTTFTSQGLGVLQQAAADLAPGITLLPAYFPFDLPGRMKQVLDAVRPRAVVLLETELWPGLLAACRVQGIPALVLNGRMTEKSLRGYSYLPWFWRALAPARVLAVSGADAGRFGQVFGPPPEGASVGLMPNIKFDRLRFDSAPEQVSGPDSGPDSGIGSEESQKGSESQKVTESEKVSVGEKSAEAQKSEEGQEPARPAFAQLLPAGSPLVILGSVRKEEEADVLKVIQGLGQARPRAVIGLFPRHMRRVCVWERLLAEAGIGFVLRSENQTAAPGQVVLWDVFGELSQAFSLARAAFIGGSLADLGGQNFLEPLAHGVTAVTGPSWSNFAWVGREIFDTGLVRLAPDWQGVLAQLSGLAAQAPDRAEVRARAQAYAASRRGGAAASCQVVAECLINA